MLNGKEFTFYETYEQWITKKLKTNSIWRLDKSFKKIASEVVL